MSAARITTDHNVNRNELMKCSCLDMSVATATMAGFAPSMPVLTIAEVPRSGMRSFDFQMIGRELVISALRASKTCGNSAPLVTNRVCPEGATTMTAKP